MRTWRSRSTAAVLSVAMLFAMTANAIGAPQTAPVDRTPAIGLKKPAGLSIASIASDAVPLVGTVTRDLPATTDQEEPSAHYYSVQLNDGEVLKATIKPTDPSVFLWADGYSSDEFLLTSAVGWNSTDGSGFDIYIPADNGSDTYFLGVLNPESTVQGYTLSYQILSGRTAATTERIPGSDRYVVAEQAGLRAFPGWAGITDVIVCSGEDRAMADPLAAAGLAGAWGAPVLLVKPVLVNGKLPTATERALTNIRTANGGKVNIHVIGGTTSVPAAVYNRIVSFRGSGTHERLAAADRYTLSANMAKRTRDVLAAQGFTVDTVLIANGENPAVFYDALAASPIAYYNAIPMMLSRKASIPTPVLNQLKTTFAGSDRFLVNTSSFLSATVRTQASQGAPVPASYIPFPSPVYDRYTVAYDIADWAYYNDLLPVGTVAVANKLSDALTGGVAMGEHGAPILYTSTGAAGLNFDTGGFLYNWRGGLTKAYILGGTSSVDNGVLAEMNDWMLWPAPVEFF